MQNVPHKLTQNVKMTLEPKMPTTGFYPKSTNIGKMSNWNQEVNSYQLYGNISAQIV